MVKEIKKEENWVEVNPTDWPETWDYRTEKELVGKLVEIKPDVGDNKSMLYTVEKEDGTRVAIWGTTVLDSRLKELPIGEKVKIVYEGESAKSKPGRNPTKLFRVFHTSAKHKENILKEEKVIKQD